MGRAIRRLTVNYRLSVGLSAWYSVFRIMVSVVERGMAGERNGRMTAAEWQVCADPRPMPAFIRDSVSERTLRPFGRTCPFGGPRVTPHYDTLRRSLPLVQTVSTSTGSSPPVSPAEGDGQ